MGGKWPIYDFINKNKNKIIIMKIKYQRLEIKYSKMDIKHLYPKLICITTINVFPSKVKLKDYSCEKYIMP